MTLEISDGVDILRFSDVVHSVNFLEDEAYEEEIKIDFGRCHYYINKRMAEQIKDYLTEKFDL